MQVENKKSFVLNCAYYGCIAILIYLFCKYLLGILVPFIIGFAAALIVRKISKAIFKTPGKKRLVVMLILLYVLLIVLVAIASVEIVNALASVNYAGLYSNYIEPAINIIYTNLTELNDYLPESIATVLDQAFSAIFDALKSVLSTVSSYIINWLRNFVVSVPNAIISIVVMIVSSCYIATGYDEIVAFGKENLPKKWVYYIEQLVTFIRSVVLKVLGSYFKIMCITCCELFIGYLILGVQNALLIAMITAVLDILPALGVGTVLLPWAVIEFVFGELGMGIGLIVMYIVITAIRNVIEPRLVGGNLGLSPLVSLVCMIIGLRLYGLIGMLGIPLIVSYLLYLRKLKKEHEDEQPSGKQEEPLLEAEATE